MNFKECQWCGTLSDTTNFYCSEICKEAILNARLQRAARRRWTDLDSSKDWDKRFKENQTLISSRPDAIIDTTINFLLDI